VEFDVQLTRDRVPVLLHDQNLQRTAGSSEQVFDLSFQQLSEFDVGESMRFGDQYSGLCAPALSEVVEALQGWPDVTAFVELKRQSLGHFGVDAVLDAVLTVLEPVMNQCVIISFVREALEAARNSYTGRIGWAVRNWDQATHESAIALAPEYLFCNVEKLPKSPQPLWQGPWSWVIYDIVDPVLARQVADRGVAFIETWEIAEMIEALAGQGGG
jgi:glycerophosphoryl diester phosphodiesterase